MLICLYTTIMELIDLDFNHNFCFFFDSHIIIMMCILCICLCVCLDKGNLSFFLYTMNFISYKGMFVCSIWYFFYVFYFYCFSCAFNLCFVNAFIYLYTSTAWLWYVDLSFFIAFIWFFLFYFFTLLLWCEYDDVSTNSIQAMVYKKKPELLNSYKWKFLFCFYYFIVVIFFLPLLFDFMIILYIILYSTCIF